MTPVPLRQRRREAAIREILDAAQEQIARDGPAGLALRSVARSLGMTVQALYHYFPSRDELITALITEAYSDLATAVQQGSGFVLAAEHFRQWGIDNPARFQLIYGTPLQHYEAPADGRTTDAARRLGEFFIGELFGEFSDSRLSRVDWPPMSHELLSRSIGGLPPPAAALFISAWGQLHGLVVLEVFGHTAFVGPAQADIFRAAMTNLLADVHRRIPAR